MHQEKIFQHIAGRPTVKSLTEIEDEEQDRMRFSVVDLLMNKVEELDQVMVDRGALEPSILPRVKIWVH